MKRCSASRIIREMQIKTTMRYHCTSQVYHHTSQNCHHQKTYSDCWRRCREKGILQHSWWKYKLMKPLWRTIWRLLNKLRIKLPHDPEFPLLSIYTWEDHNSKDTCTPVFPAALFTESRTWTQCRCLTTNEWIKKMWYNIQWNITQPEAFRMKVWITPSGWMASPIQSMHMSWADSRRWWRTGEPGMLHSVRSQKVRQDWATEQHQVKNHDPVLDEGKETTEWVVEEGSYKYHLQPCEQL